MRRPAAILFLCALLGAHFGYCAAFTLAYSLCASICTIALLIGSDRLRIIAFLLFTFFITAWSASSQQKQFMQTISQLPMGNAVFHGKIIDSSKREDGSISALVNVVDVMDQQKSIFTILLHIRGAPAAYFIGAGHAIRFRGHAQAWEKPLSSVFFDAQRFGLSQKIHARMSVNDISSLWLGEKISSTYFADLRARLVEALLRILSPREASILLALIIGETELLHKEQKTTYQIIGAQHLLAVSGLQVTLLAWLCFFFFGPLVQLILPRSIDHHGRALTALITISCAFWFVGLSGFSCSAIRAWLMTSCMLLPNMVVRRIHIFDAFFASGLVTLLLTPEAVLDWGFWLSYTAVFGMLIAGSRSQSFIRKLKQSSLLLSLCVSLAIMSIAAFLSTLPIVTIAFKAFAPLSVVANFFLVPFSAGAQVPAIVFGLIGGLFEMAPLIKWASFFGNSIEIFASLLAKNLGHITYTTSRSNMSLGLFLVAVNLIFFAMLKPSRALIAWAGALIIWPIAQYFAQIHSSFVATIIPVGQGDSTLARFPSGHVMLIDAGGSSFADFDPGEQIVIPTLKQKGINYIDVLVISHPDPDHIGGAFAVINQLIVKEIWHSGYQQNHPLTEQLIKTAREKNILVRTTKDLLGSHRFGQSEVQVLAPQTHDDYFAELGANNNSLVLRIVHDGIALLWPGDIEYFAEQLLVHSDQKLSSSVLKAPHHGSKTSSSENFIHAVNPTHVVYTTAKNNRFNFPHDEVTKRYQQRGVMEWNTATSGEITIEIYRNKIFVDGYLQPFKEKTRAVTLGRVLISVLEFFLCVFFVNRGYFLRNIWHIAKKIASIYGKISQKEPKI